LNGKKKEKSKYMEQRQAETLTERKTELKKGTERSGRNLRLQGITDEKKKNSYFDG
jgi:hypothetical protein